MSYQELEIVERGLFELVTDFAKKTPRPRTYKENLGYLISKGLFHGYDQEKIKEIKPTLKNLQQRAFIMALIEFCGQLDPNVNIRNEIYEGMEEVANGYVFERKRISKKILHNPKVLSLYKKYLERFKEDRYD